MSASAPLRVERAERSAVAVGAESASESFSPAASARPSRTPASCPAGRRRRRAGRSRSSCSSRRTRGSAASLTSLVMMYQGIGLPASRDVGEQLLGEDLEQRLVLDRRDGELALGPVVAQPRALPAGDEERADLALPQQLAAALLGARRTARAVRARARAGYALHRLDLLRQRQSAACAARASPRARRSRPGPAPRAAAASFSLPRVGKLVEEAQDLGLSRAVELLGQNGDVHVILVTFRLRPHNRPPRRRVRPGRMRKFCSRPAECQRVACGRSWRKRSVNAKRVGQRC